MAKRKTAKRARSTGRSTAPAPRRAVRKGADSRRGKAAQRTPPPPGRAPTRPAAKGASGRDARYDVHPSVALVQTWIAALKEKTGRTLEEWVDLVRNSGPAGDAAKRDWLKTEHGMGTNAAWWIVERAAGKGWEDGDPQSYLAAAVAYVEDMYAGGKAGLRPLHDELIKLGRSLGADVKICPCKTIVPLYRRRVFAEVKPSTRARIDFGLALARYVQQGGKVSRRLIDTGGMAKKDRITHRIEITRPEDIDDEVWEWLRRAYELDAE